MNLKYFALRDATIGVRHINAIKRSEAVNFLMDIKKFINNDSLSFESIHLGIELFEQVYNSDTNVKMIAIVCLMVASKIHHDYWFRPKDCVFFSRIPLNEILSQERNILKCINYRCYVPTMYEFAHLFAKKQNLPLTNLDHILNSCVYNSIVCSRLRKGASASVMCANMSNRDIVYSLNRIGLRTCELLEPDILFGRVQLKKRKFFQ